MLLSSLLTFLLLLGAKPPLHPTSVDLQHFAAALHVGSLGLAGGVAWFWLATSLARLARSGYGCAGPGSGAAGVDSR
ncbi:MAG: hypothetical protein C4289_02450 [Chloroflexota bacterium]